MIDEKKVILMTKLSICEKHGIKKDLEITKYYPEDYVYMHNIRTTVSILFVSVLFAIIHVVMSWQEEMLIPTSGEEVMAFYILPYGSVIAILLIVYTMLSTRVYVKKYRAAKKRVNRYKKILGKLEEMDQDLEMERGNYHVERNVFVDKRETNYTL